MGKTAEIPLPGGGTAAAAGSESANSAWLSLPITKPFFHFSIRVSTVAFPSGFSCKRLYYYSRTDHQIPLSLSDFVMYLIYPIGIGFRCFTAIDSEQVLFFFFRELIGNK
jgi:hypothetical protein